MSEQQGGILVVEDRSIIAAKVKRELERAGFPVARMAASEAAALQAVQRLTFLAAVLDIDLRGVPAFRVAELLEGRAIPFLFLTGYGRAAVPERWTHVPLVEKPFSGAALVQALGLTMAGHRVNEAREGPVTPAIRRAWDHVRHTRDILTEQRAWLEQHRADQRRH